jgi:hypothetical protein
VGNLRVGGNWERMGCREGKELRLPEKIVKVRKYED